MDGYTRSVLVVEADATERERLAAALEGDGFQVLLCSGPTEPDYTCIGARSGTCPLATEEAVVVLDMSLDSETVMMGTPAEDLLGMYLGSGHPVIALGSRPGEEAPGQLLRLRRHPEKTDLVTAVWRLASRRGTTPAWDHDEAEHESQSGTDRRSDGNDSSPDGRSASSGTR